MQNRSANVISITQMTSIKNYHSQQLRKSYILASSCDTVSFTNMCYFVYTQQMFY